MPLSSPSQPFVDQEIELDFGAARVTHSLMPPHEPGGYTTTSEPFSIGVSFTGHVCAVVVTDSGRTALRTFGPGTFGITAGEAVHWLRVGEPAEAVEIHPSRGLLERVERETGIAWRSVVRPLGGPSDPVIWAACARFRRAAQGAIVLSELEAEEQVHDLLVHAAVRHFGVRPRRPPRGKLPARRLARVTDLIESRLANPPNLGELARAAAMSEFHFQRRFRATTGMSPHQYVTARRMETAR
jgi:AraC family transcriptional regulator